MPAEYHISKRVGFVKFKDFSSTYIVKHIQDGVEIVNALNIKQDRVAEFDKAFCALTPKLSTPTAGTYAQIVALYRDGAPEVRDAGHRQ